MMLLRYAAMRYYASDCRHYAAIITPHIDELLMLMMIARQRVMPAITLPI